MRCSWIFQSRGSTGFDLPEPPNDAGFVQVVGGHFHFDAVAGGDADPALAHFAGDGREDHVFVVQFDPEHRSGQDRLDAAFYFDMLFTHTY